MKKLAIGCGIVLLLGMIGVSAAFYYLYYYVSTKTHEYAQAAREFAQIAELDKSITNKASFHAPSNGELTEDAMRRFVAVQESMSVKLGPRIQDLTEKSNELQRRQQTEHRDPTPAEVIGVVKDLAGLILEAKHAQVEALNASRFSLDEYDWVRRRVYAAAGMPVAPINLDNLADGIKNGATVSDTSGFDAHVPPRNKALVDPYLPRLKGWAAYAFFGL